jgi:hypothetical protein
MKRLFIATCSALKNLSVRARAIHSVHVDNEGRTDEGNRLSRAWNGGAQNERREAGNVVGFSEPFMPSEKHNRINLNSQMSLKPDKERTFSGAN